MNALNLSPKPSGGYWIQSWPDGIPVKDGFAPIADSCDISNRYHGFFTPIFDDSGTVIRLEENTELHNAWLAEEAAKPVPPTVPTNDERLSSLETQLAQADDTAIELYEAQTAQEQINNQQDESLLEIYEMIGGQTS